mmetsp:Transcript_33336/g.79715  ORF Transcript_33336/g.79715 Transcript_33336/m.79715 type:complete len:209 (-) Transcript_33336:600-1226(-)
MPEYAVRRWLPTRPIRSWTVTNPPPPDDALSHPRPPRREGGRSGQNPGTGTGRPPAGAAWRDLCDTAATAPRSETSQTGRGVAAKRPSWELRPAKRWRRLGRNGVPDDDEDADDGGTMRFLRSLPRCRPCSSLGRPTHPSGTRSKTSPDPLLVPVYRCRSPCVVSTRTQSDLSIHESLAVPSSAEAGESDGRDGPATKTRSSAASTSC